MERGHRPAGTTTRRWGWTLGRVRRVLALAMTCGSVAVLTQARPAEAAGQVGGACTEADLNTALTRGGTVTFDCEPSPATILLTGQKVVSADTRIEGDGLITLDGQHLSRIFSVNAGVTLELIGISLKNGDAGANDGGAILNSGTVIISDSRLSGNRADDGGAIRNSGSATISGSVFRDNAGSGNGGAILNAAMMTIDDSTFDDNHAAGEAGQSAVAVARCWP